jgi:lysophospholipase L1-like esterase
MRNRLSNAFRRFRRPGLTGTVSGWTQYAPNSTAFTVSDYASIAEQSASTLRFLRPITDGNGFENAAPGSRVSFTTTATFVRVSMFHNTLVTRNQAIADFYSVGAILVDGVEIKTFNWSDGYNAAGIVTIEFSIAAGSKTVTIVWPYWTGFELRKIEINTGATMTAPSRPANKIAVCGDSISQGSTASKVTTSWPYLLAIAENKQLINIANGGAMAVATDANGLTGTGCNVVTYMIGYNNFLAQTLIVDFTIAVQGWITNARAALPSAAIHVISPIYSPNTNTITLAQYRSAVQAAELAAGDANTFYVDGLSIMTNNINRLYEGAAGIHPNDLGSSEIATNLAALV